MTRKERLYKTLRGEVVDRPPVSFYEINGYDELKDPDNPFSIYTDPSWQRVLKLARDRTDRIVRLTVPITDKNVTAKIKDENNQWDPSKLLITNKSIIDMMEAEGIVGPLKGSKGREIFIDSYEAEE